MNILISSLGTNKDIVEEALGLFNYSRFDMYKGHANELRVAELRNSLDLTGHNVDEVWVIATDKPREIRKGKVFPSTLENHVALMQRAEDYGVKVRLFLLDGIPDIEDENNARAFHDLALRVVAHAQRIKGEDGNVYISLACGRKTMSADLQDAAYCFGCNQLIHVLGDRIDDALPLTLGGYAANEALTIDPKIDVAEEMIMRIVGTDAILADVEKQKSQSQHFYTTYYLNNEDRSNFHILYTLPPSKIESLRNDYIGVDPEKKEQELEYLKRLPKTELHCHLGGCLSPEEMIEVAECYVPDIEREKGDNPQYAEWLNELTTTKCHEEKLREWKVWSKEKATEIGVCRGLVVAPFLLKFKGNAELLRKLIYREYPDEKSFQQIKITPYEKLGDLQGSALLCNESALRKTMQILLRNCIKENVKYIEIRCSPINYKNGTFTPYKVLRVILEEMEKEQRIKSSLIIIASRHGEKEKIVENFELVKDFSDNGLFKKYFRGFDLAGDERATAARDMRDLFLTAMRDCQNITIHAGETDTQESIWEAVYYLNAERIGHGLTLINNPDLMDKFLERSIGIEMCPSSNYQIVGFKDNYLRDETFSLNDYPLKDYLDKELKVSINTDDPGISLTNITNEYHKAARMTKGGLSKWQILQLVCNGFRTAFYPYQQKKEMIYEAEKCLSELINKDLL